MCRWMEPVLGAVAVCCTVMLVGGCRDDLVDATPIDVPTAVAEDEAVGPAGETPLEEQAPVGVDGAPPPEAASGDTLGGAQQPAETAAGPAAVPAPQSRPSRRTDESGSAPEPASPPAASTSAPARPRAQERSAPEPRGGFQRGAPSGEGAPARRERGGVNLFEQHDADGDGLLSRSEIPEFVRERLMAADANGDGAVSPEELRSAMPRPERRLRAENVSPEERRQRMIERLDANGDGKLQVDELPERMRGAFRGADTNADGVLSVEEMQQAREALRGRRGGPPGRD